MEIEIGSIQEGKVTGIMNFGAFVSLPGGKSGLVHISEISNTFVKMDGFCKLVELIRISGIEYLSSSSQQMLLSVFL